MGSPTRRPPRHGRPRDAQRAAQGGPRRRRTPGAQPGSPRAAPAPCRAPAAAGPRCPPARARAALAGRSGRWCRAAAPSAAPARSARRASPHASTAQLPVSVRAGPGPGGARLRRLEDGVHAHVAALAHAAVQQPAALDGEVERAGHVGLERVGRVPLERHRRAVRRLLPARRARPRDRRARPHDRRAQTEVLSAGATPVLELYFPLCETLRALPHSGWEEHLCQPAHACRQTWCARPCALEANAPPATVSVLLSVERGVFGSHYTLAVHFFGHALQSRTAQSASASLSAPPPSSSRLRERALPLASHSRPWDVPASLTAAFQCARVPCASGRQAAGSGGADQAGRRLHGRYMQARDAHSLCVCARALPAAARRPQAR
jgi:hypothetical protein